MALARMLPGCTWKGKNSVAFNYSVMVAGYTMMNSVFNFYYVKVFLNVYGISQSWFNIAQVAYMIWNMVNDPLFGYFQETSNIQCCRIRRLSILYGSVFWGLSFLLPWFPWGSVNNVPDWVVGIHLVVSLCFWDTMFTFVLLAQSSLFTEFSPDHGGRVRRTQFSLIASHFGSLGVIFCEKASHNLSDWHQFQLACIVIAVFAVCCMWYTGANAKTPLEEHSGIEAVMKKQHGEGDTWLQMTMQLLRQRDFLRFVLMNLLQVTHNTFVYSFVRIFAELLVFQRGDYNSTIKTIYFGFLPMSTQLVGLGASVLVNYYGAYQLTIAQFSCKIAFGFIMYILGQSYTTVILIFFLWESSCSGAVISLFNLFLSDCADADTKMYSRRWPITSMVYGTNALITKPGHSIAPVIAVYILNHYGYEKVSSARHGDDVMTHSERDILQSAIFTLVCFIPVILGIVQLAIFSSYTMRDSHKTNKDYRNDSELI